MAPLATGTYRIENVRHRNVVYFPDANRGSLLSSRPETSDNAERWIVTALSNKRYTIQNLLHRTFATVPRQAGSGEEVRGRDNAQEWDIIESDIRDEYSIVTTDTELGWGLLNRNTGTNVALAANVDETRNRWRFVVAQVAESTTPVPTPAPGNAAAPPTDSSVNIAGVTHWANAAQAGRLTDGVYTIRNRVTNHQWALYDDSDAAWVIAPLLLFNGSPGHDHRERRFQVTVNRETGAVEITSIFYKGGSGGTRWLSDGPNFRPNRNECRIFGVPGRDLTFFICTDTRTQNTPVMVLQDIHNRPRDRLLPISLPLDPQENRQQWVFAPVRS